MQKYNFAWISKLKMYKCVCYKPLKHFNLIFVYTFLKTKMIKTKEFNLTFLATFVNYYEIIHRYIVVTLQLPLFASKYFTIIYLGQFVQA